MLLDELARLAAPRGIRTFEAVMLPVQRHVLAPADPHPHLQPLQAVQPAHPFSIYGPAFPPQQHPDPDCTRTAAARAPDRESGAAAPSDPSPCSADTSPSG